MNRYTLSVLVENQPGVLSKVVGLFSRRGFNIHSLAVGPAHDETVSCITIVVNGDEHTLEQVEKLQVEPERIEGMMQIAKLVGAEAVDIAPGLVTYKIAGETEKIENFIDMLRPYGIREIVRTGQIAIEKSGR